tara:strand:+ start:583 stop:936 length:354 start_codon:yes stop_codon:yes gene_type:complete
MEQRRKEASELYNKSMFAIKNTQSKFRKIIKFINQNQEINNQISAEMKTHLRHLIQLWKNNDDANIEYYLKMKEHHSHINGKIENETLKEMWDDYIETALKFRVDLMKLNHLCNELN